MFAKDVRRERHGMKDLVVLSPVLGLLFRLESLFEARVGILQ